MDDEAPPRPLTGEQILQDLKEAPRKDIVFSISPGPYVEGKDDSPIEKTAGDCVKLVEAIDKLKQEHSKDLPNAIDKVNAHITHLKEVLSQPSK